MKIPLHWLKDYVDIDISVDELADTLTAIGHMQDKKPERVGNDTVIDLEVRQNRPDCLSVVGVAREVVASTHSTLKEPDARVGTLSSPLQTGLIIHNTIPTDCLRFKTCTIRLPDAQSTFETPVWMRERLEAYGMKVISPLVDITNFVTLEYGEPLHAFDKEQITDNTICIRMAKKGELITILGGRTIRLTEKDMVISSKTHVLSLAGIIGGQDTGVTPKTNTIVLEAATYNQAHIRKTCIKHAIRTEASTRHEKFLHPHLAEVALNRAAHLIVEICGGTIVAHAESYPNPTQERVVHVRLSEIERLGGITIAPQKIQRHLMSLGFDIDPVSDTELRVVVPYWRTDIQHEADLVEEVLRMHGYDNIPMVTPPFAPPQNITSYWFRLEESIRDVMLSQGFDEHITEPLTKSNGDSRQIVLQNALQSQKDALRLTLQDGLRHALNHQKKFGRDAVRLFELGKVYERSNNVENPYAERRQLGLLLHDAHAPLQEVYLRAKGFVETLTAKLARTYDDRFFSLVDCDEHTVYVAVEIEHVWGPEAPKIQADQRLYTTIPHMHTFAISLYVPSPHKPGSVIKAVTDGWKEIEKIEYELFQPKNTDMIGVLLKCTAHATTDKHVLIDAITQTLQTSFQAVIR